MCLLIAPIVVKSHFVCYNLLYLSGNGAKTIFNSLLIPNSAITGKMRKLFTK